MVGWAISGQEYGAMTILGNAKLLRQFTAVTCAAHSVKWPFWSIQKPGVRLQEAQGKIPPTALA